MNTISLTQRGLEAAEIYLTRKGYSVIERGFTCRAGEADIIARDADGTLVFVEVGIRDGGREGFPEAAVTADWRRRNEEIALDFLASCEVVDVVVRFDIITIATVSGSRALLRHQLGAHSAA